MTLETRVLFTLLVGSFFRLACFLQTKIDSEDVSEPSNPSEGEMQEMRKEKKDEEEEVRKGCNFRKRRRRKVSLEHAVSLSQSVSLE